MELVKLPLQDQRPKIYLTKLDFDGFLILTLNFLFVLILDALLELLNDLVFIIIVVEIEVLDKPFGLIWVESLVFHHDSHGGGGHVVIEEHS